MPRPLGEHKAGMPVLMWLLRGHTSNVGDGGHGVIQPMAHLQTSDRTPDLVADQALERAENR